MGKLKKNDSERISHKDPIPTENEIHKALKEKKEKTREKDSRCKKWKNNDQKWAFYKN